MMCVVNARRALFGRGSCARARSAVLVWLHRCDAVRVCAGWIYRLSLRARDSSVRLIGAHTHWSMRRCILTFWAHAHSPSVHTGTQQRCSRAHTHMRSTRTRSPGSVKRINLSARASRIAITYKTTTTTTAATAWKSCTSIMLT